MFSYATAFNQDISVWDVSNVLNMKWMFFHAKNFNASIGSWNTSSVTNMQGVFQEAFAFNQNISSWDTSRVNSMHAMFSGYGETTYFNQPIGNWNTSSVTDMGFMFSENEVFNQDISSWDTSKVTTFKAMFQNAFKFNQPLGKWDTGSTKVMSSFFKQAYDFNQDISRWNVRKVEKMDWMFMFAYDFDQDIQMWDVSSLTYSAMMFYGANSFQKTIACWSLTLGDTINTSQMFDGATAFLLEFPECSGSGEIPSCSGVCVLPPPPSPPSPPPPAPITGRIIDGYLVNCNAWIDINGDESRDESFEPFVLTSTYGAFTLQPTNDSVANSANLVVDMSNSACVDAFTSNSPGLQILSAPPKASIVTPLSTLVTELLKLNASYDANSMVVSAFGLDASVDILNTDPFEGMITNAQVYKNTVVANTLIANAISSMMRLIQGAGGSSLKNSQSSAFKALATLVVSANNRPSRRRSLLTFAPLLDLTNVTVVSELAENTVSQAKTDGALSSSASVSPSSIEAVSNATANSGSIISEAAENVSDSGGSSTFLNTIAATVKVMQKPETLDAIVSVVSGSDSNALANFTNAEELTLSVESASNEVSVDIPSSTPPLLSEAEPPSSILDLTSSGMRLSACFLMTYLFFFLSFFYL